MTNKKNNSILGVLAVIAVIIVGAAYMGGYLSFALNPLPLPASVYSGPISTPCGSCSGQYVLGTQSYGSLANNNTAYLYGVMGFSVFNYYGLQVQSSPTLNIYIAVNYTGVSYANQQNNAQLPGLSSSIASAYASGSSCPGNPSQCVLESNYYYAMNLTKQILLSAIIYNNAIPKPITTTTTIPVTPSLPSNPLTAFWNGLSALWNKILAFLVAPLQLSVATSQNFTVSAPFTTQVSLMIPAQWQTMNTSTASGKTVQQTFCGTFVLNNQSAVLQSSTPTITYGSYYNNTFSYTPSARQILVVGGLCRTDSIQYSVVSGTWGSWSAWNTTVNQSAIAKAGITTVTPNQVTAFFTGVFTWINNFLKSLGL